MVGYQSRKRILIPASSGSLLRVRTGKKGVEMLIVFLKEITEPKVQYNAAKKLHELGVGSSFRDIYSKIKQGQGVVIMRTESQMVAEKQKKIFEDLGGTVEITEQKTIGGKAVY